MVQTLQCGTGGAEWASAQLRLKVAQLLAPACALETHTLALEVQLQCDVGQNGGSSLQFDSHQLACSGVSQGATPLHDEGGGDGGDGGEGGCGGQFRWHSPTHLDTMPPPASWSVQQPP